jgi:hypothetical protein
LDYQVSGNDHCPVSEDGIHTPVHYPGEPQKAVISVFAQIAKNAYLHQACCRLCGLFYGVIVAHHEDSEIVDGFLRELTHEDNPEEE